MKKIFLKVLLVIVLFYSGLALGASLENNRLRQSVSELTQIVQNDYVPQEAEQELVKLAERRGKENENDLVILKKYYQEVEFVLKKQTQLYTQPYTQPVNKKVLEYIRNDNI